MWLCLCTYVSPMKCVSYVLFECIIYLSPLLGISFVCFFAVIVSNSGGPEGCLRAMMEQNRKACCCCPSDPFKLYQRVQFAVFQFLVFRPIVVTIGAVFVYLDINAIFLVCKFVSVIMFVFGFGSLAIFCK